MNVSTSLSLITRSNPFCDVSGRIKDGLELEVGNGPRDVEERRLAVGLAS